MIVNKNLGNSKCALSVRTGSYDDTIPGIAHFLEHMVFMGSSLCKNANYFEQFLAQNNGNLNGTTKNDKTSFYFEINCNKFEKALKLFADCFKTPKFELDSIKSEIISIDSEFFSECMYENNRSEQLRNFFSNEPFNNFGWGNKQTLLVGDNSDDDLKYEKLQEEIIKFWNENYDSTTMKLVVYHHTNILNLISNLFETILSIPNKKTLPIIEIDRYDNNFIRKLYRPEFTNKYIYVKPITNIDIIEINIEIPNVKLSFKNNILTYLKCIFESWHNESLLNQYEKAELAKKILFEIENTLYVSYLRIEITLTLSGCNKIKQVIDMFYKYLHIFTYSKKEYNLYKRKFRMDFEFTSNHFKIDEIEKMAVDMQYYPIQNILNHDYMFENFDNLEIKGLLDIIKNYDNWLVFIFSKKNFICKQEVEIEEFFNTEYIVSDKLVIEQKYQSKDNNQNIISPRIYLLHKIGQSLPFMSSKNKYYLKNNNILRFIPFLKNTCYDKPSLLVCKQKDDSNKIKLFEKEEEGGKFTFIYNPTYSIPKSYVSVKLNTKITKENHIIFNIYLEMAVQIYCEKYQEYDYLNGSEIKFFIVKTGIEVQFHGYSKKIIICIWNFFKAFFNIHFDNFLLAKNRGITTFNEISSKKPFDYVFDILENEIYDFCPSSDDLAKQRNKLKKEDIKLEHKYYLEMFVCSDNAPELFLALFDYLYSQKIIPAEKFHHEHKFEKYKYKCVTIHNKHSAVGIFYKNQPITNIKSIAIIKMILSYYEENFNNYLRNKENLGYCVELKESVINGVQYLGFVAQSEYDCKTIEKK